MPDPQAASRVPAAIPVRAFETRVTPFRWPWAEANRGAIEAGFERARASNPALFNGRILLTHAWEIRDGTYVSEAFETDFASLYHWREIGWPDAGVVNVFGSAVVTCGEAVLLARMAGHTANAGRVYFPAGTPDLSDVRDDRLDYDGSIARELAEEAGLAPPVVEPTEQRFAVLDGPRISLARIYRAALSGPALLAAARAHLESEAEPELSDVLLVRSTAELAGESAPPFVATMLRRLLEEGEVE